MDIIKWHVPLRFCQNRPCQHQDNQYRLWQSSCSKPKSKFQFFQQICCLFSLGRRSHEEVEVLLFRPKLGHQSLLSAQSSKSFGLRKIILPYNHDTIIFLPFSLMLARNADNVCVTSVTSLLSADESTFIVSSKLLSCCFSSSSRLSSISMARLNSGF